jgi:hypothetical protein
MEITPAVRSYFQYGGAFGQVFFYYRYKVVGDMIEVEIMLRDAIFSVGVYPVVHFLGGAIRVVTARMITIRHATTAALWRLVGSGAGPTVAAR